MNRWNGYHIGDVLVTLFALMMLGVTGLIVWKFVWLLIQVF
jgi:hypothetical protein